MRCGRVEGLAGYRGGQEGRCATHLVLVWSCSTAGELQDVVAECVGPFDDDWGRAEVSTRREMDRGVSYMRRTVDG